MVSKIAVDCDCSHGIRRWLLPGRKPMINLNSVLKSRDISLPTRVHIVKAMVFPVVTCGCDSRAVEKAEGGITDDFEPWCWRRLPIVPWTARRSNQTVLREINPEYSLERLMLKLKFHYFITWCKQMTHWKSPCCWERLRAEGEESIRGWDGWMPSLIHNGHELRQTSGDGEGQRGLAGCSP